MNKLEMAHQWAMKCLESGLTAQISDLVAESWKYADLMQAEADKRLKTDVGNTDASEWQPDWSQSPEWANWWAMDGFSKKANWYIDKPYLDDDSEVESEWNIDLKTNAETYMCAPSFNYQGNWQDSLRKRPQ